MARPLKTHSVHLIHDEQAAAAMRPSERLSIAPEAVSDLAAGIAGEYLVCADLLLRGYPAFPSDQGLPYDVVVQVKTRLLRIQVKTTRGMRKVPQREHQQSGYLFYMKRMGHDGKQLRSPNSADMFALVALGSWAAGLTQEQSAISQCRKWLLR